MDPLSTASSNLKYCINCSRCLSSTDSSSTGPKGRRSASKSTKHNNKAVKEISLELKLANPTMSGSGQMILSILDILTCIFPSTSILQSISPEAEEFAMCSDCGTSLCNLYGAYFQLLNLSNANSRITKLIQQFEIWHSLSNDTMSIEPHEVVRNYVEALRSTLDGSAFVTQEHFEDNGSESGDMDIHVKTEESEQPELDSEIDIKFDVNAVANADAEPPIAKRQKLQLRVVTGQTLEEQIDPTEKNTLFTIIIPKSPKKQYTGRIAFDCFNVPTATLPKHPGPANPRYSCPVCNKLCLFKWEMGLHYLNAHEGKRPGMCDKCKFLSYDEYMLRTHHCTSAKYRCIFCGMGFKHMSGWRYHGKTHEEGYVSRLDKLAVPNKSGIPLDPLDPDDIPIWDPYRTKKFKGINDYPCKISECSAQFLYKWEMEMHVLIYHQNTIREECDKCRFKYIDDKLFKNHSCITEDERKAEGLKYRCNYCGKCFKTTTPWIADRRLHEKDLPRFKCPVEGCTKVLMFQKLIKRHIECSHSNRPKKKRPPEPRVPCSVCGKVLTCHSLSIHMVQKHSGGLPRNYVCHICGKSFQFTAILESHMRYVHSTLRPYKCPICGVSFKGSGELRTHWKGKIHSKEEVADLLKSKIVPNVEPNETPILPHKKSKRSEMETLS